jgi:antitoxin component YwqK of YwqJK toxin-antitoxin module
MKTNTILLTIVIFLLLTAGCQNKAKKNSSTENKSLSDTTTVADTGYTGIKQYYSGARLVKEVTFKNGIRQGLMKSYYASGLLRQTFWYENGRIQDTAKWYFEDSIERVFRKTPMKDDSAHGIQIQYYRTGVVRAKLEFVNGLRTPFIEEFESNGRKITDYSDVVIQTKDEYKQNGTYVIYTELTKKNIKATFYRGEYINGLFNPKKYAKINTTDFTGRLELKKSATAGNKYIGIIAEISTPIGNKSLIYKKIDLPYNDLK